MATKDQIDDEIGAATVATLGSLSAFVEQKLGG